VKLLRGAALASELSIVATVFQIAAQSGYLDTHSSSNDAFVPYALFALAVGFLVPWLTRPGDARPGVRGGILRALVSAVLLAVANAAVVRFVRFHVAIDYIDEAWAPFATGALLGLAAGPLVAVEAGAEREAPGHRRDREAAFAALLLAYVLLILVGLEFRYVFEMIRTGSVRESLEATGTFSEGLLKEPLQVGYRVFPYAIPFALLAFARARKQDLVRQTEVVYVGTAAILVACAVLNGAFEGHVIRPSGSFVFFPLRRGAVLVTAGLLPLGARIADLIEARWRAERDQ
jgi:hypothetical protein